MSKHIAERVEMMKLLTRLRQGDEKPGWTILRALREAASRQPTQ